MIAPRGAWAAVWVGMMSALPYAKLRVLEGRSESESAQLADWRGVASVLSALQGRQRVQHEIAEAIAASVDVPLLVYPEGAVNPVSALTLIAFPLTTTAPSIYHLYRSHTTSTTKVRWLAYPVRRRCEPRRAVPKAVVSQCNGGRTAAMRSVCEWRWRSDPCRAMPTMWAPLTRLGSVDLRHIGRRRADALREVLLRPRRARRARRNEGHQPVAARGRHYPPCPPLKHRVRSAAAIPLRAARSALASRMHYQ